MMIQYRGGYLLIISACILGGIFLGYLIHGDSSENAGNETINSKNNIMDIDYIWPSNILELSNDSFLVSDFYDKSLYSITRNGTIKQTISRDVAKPYGYWNIAGLARDSQSNIYLSDAGTHRILKFNSNGTLLDIWGKFGSEKGEFDTPAGILVVNESGDEKVFVCDTGNSRIQVFSHQGQFLHSLLIPKDENKKVEIQKPIESDNSYNLNKFVITPEVQANPALVDRTFTIQSSGSTLPLTFEINRSVYLGSQKISFQSPDIAIKNPEEWISVLSVILKDQTTQNTLNQTLKEIRRQANIHKLKSGTKLESIIHFVQQIPLTNETENKYPIEIIHDKTGNTYDKALFLYGLLSIAGYDVVYLSYPGLLHAAVGIRLSDSVNSEAIAIYRDSNDNNYMYINSDGPSFIGGIAQKYRKMDPFVIHLDETTNNSLSISADHLYSTYVMESIFSLSEKYQFLLNKEKEVKGDELNNVKEKIKKIKSVLDFIEKNPWNTEIAYMRIKNSKVNDIIV